MSSKNMSPREKRLLHELVANERVSVKDLRSRIGALNPAQVKLLLVRRGWIIQTGFNAIFDRDGNLCRPGYYWMEFQERERARKLLQEIDGATCIAPSSIALLITNISEELNSKIPNQIVAKEGKNG